MLLLVLCKCKLVRLNYPLCPELAKNEEQVLLSQRRKKPINGQGVLKISGSSFHLALNCATYLKLLLGRGGKRPLQNGIAGDKIAPQNKCPNRHQGNHECKTYNCLDTICQDIKNAIPGTKRSITNSRTCQAQGF